MDGFASGRGESLLQLANAMLRIWIRIPRHLGVFGSPCPIRTTSDVTPATRAWPG